MGWSDTIGLSFFKRSDISMKRINWREWIPVADTIFVPKACWDELRQQPLIFYFLSGECTFHLKALPVEYTSNGANPCQNHKKPQQSPKRTRPFPNRKVLQQQLHPKEGESKIHETENNWNWLYSKILWDTVHSLQIYFVGWLGLTLLQALTASLMSLRAWGIPHFSFEASSCVSLSPYVVHHCSQRDIWYRSPKILPLSILHKPFDFIRGKGSLDNWLFLVMVL